MGSAVSPEKGGEVKGKTGPGRVKDVARRRGERSISGSPFTSKILTGSPLTRREVKEP